ncbi:hypothetical protein CTI12_AA618520 [Artemisia annua]|uniref:Uncharacterized protein n=1 Tax=Artemisia annua TaxID=35608 RepID=A0A2U1KCP8_ARTAN|nr:hypothetical protein CTI12_AA618520 [Artemisia annua]
MDVQSHSWAIFILLIMMLNLCHNLESQKLDNVTDVKSARTLDKALQRYAFQAFTSLKTAKTGVSVDGVVPKDLSGVKVSALRLRSGSLFTRGVMYKEFMIPKGVVEKPYAKRLVLVYQNLGNLSSVYYPLNGYVYLAPVLGLLAYEGLDLTAKNLSELDIRASGEPVVIDFEQVRIRSVVNGSNGSNPMCIWVDLNGQVNFTNVVFGTKCLGYKHGHFSIVVKAGSNEVAKPIDKSGGNGSRVWLIVGSVVGGCVLFMLVVFCVKGYSKKKKISKMERAADFGEPLHMTMIGSMKAPAAMVTRTQPTLETEYAP